jgi:hypothetical protein
MKSIILALFFFSFGCGVEARAQTVVFGRQPFGMIDRLPPTPGYFSMVFSPGFTLTKPGVSEPIRPGVFLLDGNRTLITFCELDVIETQPSGKRTLSVNCPDKWSRLPPQTEEGSNK